MGRSAEEVHGAHGIFRCTPLKGFLSGPLLVEKEKHLGGQIALAETFSFKKSFTRLLEYYSEALASAGVEVYLDSNIDETLAKFGDCIDVVVFATGNKIPVPDRFIASPTISSSVLDGLSHLGTLGSKVAIIGANLLGAEAAWHLAKHGREVSLVERSNRFADDVNLINQIVFPNVLPEAGVSVLMETEGLMATSRGLKVQYRNSEREIVVDNILISFGAAPIGVSDQLQKLCKNSGAGIHVIQQQHKKYPLYWATHSAHQLARVL
jgi:pyruvate/2-oxoglutarate dehydrogenase complex dihydrolipoamide dehydrogenase (E3) component